MKSERDEDEDRRQRERDLQRRVDDHRDREVGPVARGELNADDVLDGVAGDRHDHETGEVLAHVQRVDRRRQRVRRTSRSVNAAAVPATARTTAVDRSRPARRRVLLAGPARRNDGSVTTNTVRRTPAQIERERLAVRRGRRVERMRQRRDRHRRGGEHGEHRHHPCLLGVEPLRPVAKPADDERDPEHEHAVREDRADERRLDDVDEPVVQGEERDEELRAGCRGADWTTLAPPEPSRAPSCSVAVPTRRARAASASGGDEKRGHVVQPRVMADPGQDDRESVIASSMRSRRFRRRNLPGRDRGPSPIGGGRFGDLLPTLECPVFVSQGVSSLRHALLVLTLVVGASVLASTANASELIDRNAAGINLRRQRQGRGAHLVPRRRQVEARARVGRAERDRVDPRTAAGRRSSSTTRAGAASTSSDYWKTFKSTCGAYDGPTLAWMVTACKASDGSYWALQAWQRMLPNYGVAPCADAGCLGASSLALDRRPAGADDRHRLGLAPVGSPLRHLHVRRPAGVRLQVDARRRPARHVRPQHLRRHLRLEVRQGWKRENSFLTHTEHGRLLLLVQPARRATRRARARSTARPSKARA